MAETVLGTNKIVRIGGQTGLLQDSLEAYTAGREIWGVEELMEGRSDSSSTQ